LPEIAELVYHSTPSNSGRISNEQILEDDRMDISKLEVGPLLRGGGDVGEKLCPVGADRPVRGKKEEITTEGYLL
jgi:hypothetical protein